jgi:ABC-type nitrate/sulfonate/bicarbonate transport system ATPase subunit
MSANARKWLNVTSSEDSAQVAIQYRFLNTLNNPHQFARMVSILGKSGGAKSFLISGLLEKPGVFHSESNPEGITSGADLYFQEDRSCAWVDVEGFGMRGRRFTEKMAAVPLFGSTVSLLNCAISGGRADYHGMYCCI